MNIAGLLRSNRAGANEEMRNESPSERRRAQHNKIIQRAGGNKKYQKDRAGQCELASIGLRRSSAKRNALVAHAFAKRNERNEGLQRSKSPSGASISQLDIKNGDLICKSHDNTILCRTT